MERRHLAGRNVSGSKSRPMRPLKDARRLTTLGPARCPRSRCAGRRPAFYRAGKMPAFHMLFFDDIDFVQTQDLPLGDLWTFLPIGYLFTIAIETPVLLIGLASKVPLKQKLWCGVWLTACTYPIVVLVLPAIFFGQSRILYLAIAETFAPVAECILFWLAFRGKSILDASDWVRCFVTIIIANLASFGAGEILNYYGWFGWF
jgi:hypothetical protein